MHPGIHTVWDGDTADQDHQRCHGANDDGVQKHFYNTHHPLFYRVVDDCGGVGNGCCAHTCFVGKDPTGNTDAKRCQHSTNDTTGYRLGRKCALKDSSKGIRNCLPAGNQHGNSQQKIQPRGKGNQQLRPTADPISSTQQHGTNEGRQ